ncbi:MAG: glutamate--tRNA ligase [Alphaproteobacteria bacterium]
MTVRVRFAPSPTGYLHIGGARTALFNYLFARHHGGQYLLRIEDTDKARSTQGAIDAIQDGLGWLGLEGDEPILFQSTRIERHQHIAHRLLEEGKAYRCYATPDELSAMREQAKQERDILAYNGLWRDRSDYPENQPYTIRLKMPRDGGSTTLNDLVQGSVSVAHDQLDDFILLRADGTPTYMLSVVVDDYDMGITHIIRGDDHLNNAFRQDQLFKAAGFDTPIFAHIPLIHGADGAKLSKRHGALGVHEYRDMGYLPQALKNYLLRLGWSHGDEEIISEDQAIEWFNLDAVGRSAARFDVAKLENINAHYLRGGNDEQVLRLLIERLGTNAESPIIQHRLKLGLEALCARATNLNLLAENAQIYLQEPDYNRLSDKGKKQLSDGSALFALVMDRLQGVKNWDKITLDAALRALAEDQQLGFGKIASPVRAALSGLDQSPGVFDLLIAFGSDESRRRLSLAQAFLQG